MMIPTAVLTAQYAGTLEYFETSRVDLRATQPPYQAPTPPSHDIPLAADATFAPTARLRLNDRRWDYTLIYSPTFTTTDVELVSAAQPVLLNAGTASIGWHDRFVRVLVSEAASYGWENLAYLYGLPVAGQLAAPGQAQSPGQSGAQTPGQAPGSAPIQTLGQTGTAPAVPVVAFPFGSSTTTATVLVRTSRDVTLGLSGSYTLSGNLSNSTQVSVAYPEQYGPSASASVAATLSPVDTLTTRASAQQITTPMGACISPTQGAFCRQDVPSLLLEETARHRLSRTAAIAANLGVSASVYQLSDGEALGILPVGGLSYSDRFGRAPRDPRDPVSGVQLSAVLAPTVNVLTGSPSNRVQLAATLVTHVTPDVAVTLVAGGLQTVQVPVPDPSPLTLVNGGVSVRFRLNRLFAVSVGVQGFWQAQQNVGAIPAANAGNTPTTSSSEVGYVALTVRAPTLRL